MEVRNKAMFGCLTQKRNGFYGHGAALDILFKNYKNKSQQFNLINGENDMAMENLRKLTVTLQTKRLRENTKEYCKYFLL